MPMNLIDPDDIVTELVKATPHDAARASTVAS